MQSQHWQDSVFKASSQSRSTSEFFSKRFVGLLLRESESKTTSQPTFVFLCGIHQDGICCCRPLRLLCFVGDGVPGTASQLACAVRAASGARVTRVPRVMAAALVFAACFCFFVDPDTRLGGDQGHAFAQSARGFLSWNGLLFVSTYRSCGD